MNLFFRSVRPAIERAFLRLAIAASPHALKFRLKLTCKLDSLHGQPTFHTLMNQQNLSDCIWSVADLLRGNFRQSELGRIILPFTVLRRLECVLEPTRQAVREAYAGIKGTQIDPSLILPSTAGANFYNTFEFSLERIRSN